MAQSQQLDAPRNMIRAETDSAETSPGLDKIWLPDVKAVTIGKQVTISNPHASSVLVVNGVGVRVGVLNAFHTAVVTAVAVNPDKWTFRVQ